jgi:hypothetical protein
MTFAEVRERLAVIGWNITLTDEGKVRTSRPAADGQPTDERDYETLAEAYGDTILRNAAADSAT